MNTALTPELGGFTGNPLRVASEKGHRHGDGISAERAGTGGGVERKTKETVMAGLFPAIPTSETQCMRNFYVYILASRPGGALYVGVTNDLIRRIDEHKRRMAESHTKCYRIDKLVYFEQHATAYQAIQREKNMKHWPPVYKTRLIAQDNAEWRDLYSEIAHP